MKGAVVQVRMGSTRLPGKALLRLAARPVLWHVIDRLQACREIERIVVATSTEPADDAIAASLEAYRPLAGFGGVPWSLHRGPLHDVLGRFVEAATREDLDPIVRITADCPLIDPEVVDRVVALFLESPCDYASNIRSRRTFPRGLDTEVFSRSCLERMASLAATSAEREHVTLCVETHPDAFVCRCLEHDRDLSGLRWTLDTPADYRLISILYDELYDPARPFSFRQAAAYCEQHPELAEIVAGVEQKDPHRGE
jgi:spore coat polysaccharide biosynthesis protein SpsF (cytidylyltransferase family)